jgi:hypothetical protein
VTSGIIGGLRRSGLGIESYERVHSDGCIHQSGEFRWRPCQFARRARRHQHGGYR